MSKQTLDLGSITVESFQVQNSSLQAYITSPIDERPAGWETDEAQNSMCYVSCDGSCRCGTL
jgi:hypothetical protein